MVKQVPSRGPEQSESKKTVLYPQIIIILVLLYIIIKLLIMAETGNGTPFKFIYTNIYNYNSFEMTP